MESFVAAAAPPATASLTGAGRAMDVLALTLVPRWRATACSLGGNIPLSGSFTWLLMSRFAPGPEANHRAAVELIKGHRAAGRRRAG